MVKTNLSIQEKTELILDKIDNDIVLNKEEEYFYYKTIMKIKSETWINFIMNGCDLPDSEKPTDPSIGYEV